eukprot:jgi/Psemu1/27908/gm1.27908_g
MKNCLFYNLKGRTQCAGCSTNNLIARRIQQATLDAFWSREWSTVAKSHKLARLFDCQVHMAKEFSCLPAWCPLPQEDCWGMKVTTPCVYSLRQSGNVVQPSPTTFTHVQRGLGLISPYKEEGAVLYLPRWLTLVGLIISPLDATCIWEMCGYQRTSNSGNHGRCLRLHGGEVECNGRLYELGDLKFFTHPLALKTEKGRNILDWFERMKDNGKMENITDGSLFMNKEQTWRATIANLDKAFHDYL